MSSSLLNLPGELRDKIWRFAFGELEVESCKNVSTEEQESSCIACDNLATAAIPYEYAFHPLLACKRIYSEGSIILNSTLNLHITHLGALQKIQTHASQRLRTDLQTLTLHIHLQEDNRISWLAILLQLTTIFPALKQLTVHNHMRPPLGYSALIDAIHVVSPLVNLPPTLFPNNTVLHCAYTSESVMFEDANLGIVRVSDALPEHEAVIRDLLSDLEFKKASEEMDMHQMSNCLLRSARDHEGSWYTRLLTRARREA